MCETYNCLSVDVEEYFHCEVFANGVSRETWLRMERRARPQLERIATLLEASSNRATFFVLGWTVEYLKDLLRDLRDAGHELACHGYGHQHLARLGPDTFRADIRRARGVMEDVLGVRPVGYRAPTFSITHRTAWALDVLIEEGFAYDASVFPIRHDRYGIPDAPLVPFVARTPTGRALPEFPPLTVNVGGWHVPVGGGGYMRLLPSWVLRKAVVGCVRRCQPAMIYVHPWELDPDQPRLPAGMLATWRHRVNLSRTAERLERLLATFRFAPACEVLAAHKRQVTWPVFQVGIAARDALATG